jgi:hypothetical protein
VLLNLSLKTLVCKHIFWVMHKEFEIAEVAQQLKQMQRKLSSS